MRACVFVCVHTKSLHSNKQNQTPKTKTLKEILSRAAAKDDSLSAAGAARHRHNELSRVTRELHASDRQDKVDSIAKLQAYQRELLFQKIVLENERTARLLAQRGAIQRQRRDANMAASQHRQKVFVFVVVVCVGGGLLFMLALSPACQTRRADRKPTTTHKHTHT